MKIAILKENNRLPFDGDQYIVKLNREFGGYKTGDLICHCAPFFDIPLQLEIAIRNNGELIFRRWAWSKHNNTYLHTTEICEEDTKLSGNEYKKPFIPTQEQIDTVNGLFSGRIRFEGLKLAPGASLQRVCPINVEKEEELTGKKIYLT